MSFGFCINVQKSVGISFDMIISCRNIQSHCSANSVSKEADEGACECKQTDACTNDTTESYRIEKFPLFFFRFHFNFFYFYSFLFLRSFRCCCCRFYSHSSQRVTQREWHHIGAEDEPVVCSAFDHSICVCVWCVFA